MGCMGARFSISCSEKGIVSVATERKVASNHPGPLSFPQHLYQWSYMGWHICIEFICCVQPTHLACIGN
jgi:hypothetical protein